MRIEATLPDPRGAAILELAEELGLTRSQLVDEALSLFMKAVLEVKRGRRLVTIDPLHSQPACELATPTLTTLEWTSHPETIKLSAPEFERLAEIIDEPAEPTESLRRAAAEHGRRLADRADSAKPPAR